MCTVTSEAFIDEFLGFVFSMRSPGAVPSLIVQHEHALGSIVCKGIGIDV